MDADPTTDPVPTPDADSSTLSAGDGASQPTSPPPLQEEDAVAAATPEAEGMDAADEAGDAAPEVPRAEPAEELVDGGEANEEEGPEGTVNGRAGHLPAEGPVLPRACDPHPVPAGAPLDHPALYFNRELSWLDFNWRVFAQAIDDRNPLLERVRFLAIAVNNLDEFYRKRIGGLKRQLAAGVRIPSPDGRSPREQLVLAQDAAERMQAAISEVWASRLQPDLDRAGLGLRTYRSLSDESRKLLDAHFRAAIFPILTPLAVDPGHPFPFLSNLSLSLAVSLRHPARGTEHFARLKVPTSRGRWLPVPGHPGQYIAVEDLIRHNLEGLFRGMEIAGCHAFRITRNADVELVEEGAEDLMELISEELRERKFAEVVRLEVESGMPGRVRELLERELDIDESDIVSMDGLLDLTGLFELASTELPLYAEDAAALRFPPWEPVVPPRLRFHDAEDNDLFTAIRHSDILVHHPYESFAATTQRFVEEAAVDPRVLAIKMTLYRTSRESPIVRALIRAAENGKQVAALIELKARFDEANNIAWAEQLEKAAVHVTYGLVGLKTHAKTILVVREEGDRLRAYCHLGTGNYNPSTARLYTDFGLLTCSDDVGSDAVNLFHYLTGYAPEQHYQTLAVGPRDLRSRFLELIDREIEHQRRGGTGRIIAKMNALDDLPVIEALYRASQAGVRIHLIVRGHCRLRPGVPGYSDNILVLSIVGRFLEHSRIFHFHNDGAPET
ncbi:MAG TPA: polyphosphate kinase 1, partial [Rhodothermales bacterium]|nr:polyphosphate kinase 1 [Rhodothermales bacterium]